MYDRNDYPQLQRSAEEHAMMNNADISNMRAEYMLYFMRFL
jgi:hypothetical protein